MRQSSGGSNPQFSRASWMAFSQAPLIKSAVSCSPGSYTNTTLPIVLDVIDPWFPLPRCNAARPNTPPQPPPTLARLAPIARAIVGKMCHAYSRRRRSAATAGCDRYAMVEDRASHWRLFTLVRPGSCRTPGQHSGEEEQHARDNLRSRHDHYRRGYHSGFREGD